MIIYMALILFVAGLTFFRNQYALEEPQRLRGMVYREDLKLALVLAVLLAMAGLRSHTGTDYDNYATAFGYYRDGIDPYWLNFEPGFIALIRLVIRLGGDVQVLFFLSALLTVAFLYAAVRRTSDDVIFSVFLYCSLYFYFSSYNLVRQAIAMAVVLWAVRDIIERRPAPFCLKIGLAMLFHTSALFALPFYFVGHKRLRPRWYAAAACVVLALRLAYRPLIGLFVRLLPQYALYLDYQGGGALTNIAVLLVNFALLLPLQKKEGMGEKDERRLNVFLNACFLALCLYSFARLNTLASRIAGYYYAFSIFSLPFCVRSFGESRRDRVLVKIGIFLVTMAVCIYNFRGNNGGIVPYGWIFSG